MSGGVVPGKHAEGKPNWAEAENKDEVLRNTVPTYIQD